MHGCPCQKPWLASCWQRRSSSASETEAAARRSDAPRAGPEIRGFQIRSSLFPRSKAYPHACQGKPGAMGLPHCRRRLARPAQKPDRTQSAKYPLAGLGNCLGRPSLAKALSPSPPRSWLSVGRHRHHSRERSYIGLVPTWAAPHSGTETATSYP